MQSEDSVLSFLVALVASSISDVAFRPSLSAPSCTSTPKKTLQISPSGVELELNSFAENRFWWLTLPAQLLAGVWTLLLRFCDRLPFSRWQSSQGQRPRERKRKR